MEGNKLILETRKIIIVEDEEDIREIIQYTLNREGYKAFSVDNGQDALQMIRETIPDLVLLDLMLPDLSGIDICRHLKSNLETEDIRIVMVTAKGTEADIVLGLSLGADDYVTKPFSPRELLERVKAVLRRSSSRNLKSSSKRVVKGPLDIDQERHEVRIEGRVVFFTATEFNLLFFLATHPGIVFTRNQLLNQVMGENAFVVDRNVDVHIRSIRKKMGDHRSLLETIRGIGYRFFVEE